MSQTPFRIDKYFWRKCLLAFVAVVAAGGIWVGLNVGLVVLTLPDVGNLSQETIEPSKTTRIYAADGTVIMSYGKFAHQPVLLSDISPTLKQAVLATEDRRFYKHRGVDPQGIIRALLSNVQAGGIKEGGSTISQQLARTIYLTRERSWLRKAKEALIAGRLEQKFSKDEILALYMNNVYFGEGAYGVEAASRVYFNKPAKKMSPEEAAMLAGLIQAPSSYDPYTHPLAAKNRRNQVLHAMASQKLISAQAAKKLAVAPLKLSGKGFSSPDKTPFFNRYVMQQAMDHLNVQDEKEFWDDGYRIHTTLDMRAQNLAEHQLSRLRSEGAMLSLDRDNRMLAYAGGRNFSSSQYDHITQARRPAGSLIKALIYTTALKRHMSPRDVYDDAPVCFGEWCPRNYDRRHHGEMSLAQALVKSNNVIAVEVLNDVGPQSLIDTARSFGLQGDMKPYLSLALGATEVNLAEMTAAYSVFRNNGVYAEPYGIESITDLNGNELYLHRSQERVVLDRRVRDTMVTMLQGVMQYGTGRGASINRVAAGKTGTSDNYKDAWFVGFTPEITTGVWIGYDNNRRMAGVTGGSLPASLWRGYMSGYLAGHPPQSFDLAYSMPIAKEDFFGPQRWDTMIVQNPVGAVHRIFRFITIEHSARNNGRKPVIKQRQPSRKHTPVIAKGYSEGISTVSEEQPASSDSPREKGKTWKAVKKGFKNSWTGFKSVLDDDDS